MYIKSLKFFSLLLVIALHVNAQRTNIVLGPELNLPTGNSTNASPLGYGAYLKAEVGLTQKFSLTANGAVASFLGKRIIGPRTSTRTYFPIKAGLKYYTESNFYFEAQVGASLPATESGTTSFAWSPGIGSFIKNRNNANQLDIGFRYEGWGSGLTKLEGNSSSTAFSFFSLRIGYAFNL